MTRVSQVAGELATTEVSPVSITVQMANIDNVATLTALFAEGDRLHAAAEPERFRYAEPEVMAWRRRELAAILTDPEQPVFLAERDGRAAGALRLAARASPGTPVTLPRRFLVVQELVVREPLRRSGVGRALLEHAHRWASAHGIREIELNVLAFNASNAGSSSHAAILHSATVGKQAVARRWPHAVVSAYGDPPHCSCGTWHTDIVAATPLCRFRSCRLDSF